jgi:hypothetical protein
MLSLPRPDKLDRLGPNTASGIFGEGDAYGRAKLQNTGAFATICPRHWGFGSEFDLANDTPAWHFLRQGTR